MRMRCRAGSKFVGGRSSSGAGRRPAAMGVVARAGVLPQFATAAHPCAARPPWRHDGVLRCVWGMASIVAMRGAASGVTMRSGVHGDIGMPGRWPAMA